MEPDARGRVRGNCFDGVSRLAPPTASVLRYRRELLTTREHAHLPRTKINVPLAESVWPCFPSLITAVQQY